jgi:hypothetical protein
MLSPTLLEARASAAPPCRGKGVQRPSRTHAASCACDPQFTYLKEPIMKPRKLLLATLAATVLLGALVSSASASRLENSSLTNRASWTRMDFTGGFGTFECEVVLKGSFHTRSIAKNTSNLIGYITEGTVTRCARDSATINRGSLPWHRRYSSFAGTLPLISGIAETVTGAELTLREAFGITCTVRATESSMILTYTLSAGTVTSASSSGRNRCSGLEFELGGTTSAVDNGSGTRLTIRLI